jgi:hypothetical protein
MTAIESLDQFVSSLTEATSFPQSHQILPIFKMKLDTQVARILSIDSSKASVAGGGGGGCSFASTSRITSIDHDGTEQQFFMKSGSGQDSEIMFRGTLHKSWVNECTLNRLQENMSLSKQSTK